MIQFYIVKLAAWSNKKVERRKKKPEMLWWSSSIKRPKYMPCTMTHVLAGNRKKNTVTTKSEGNG